MHACTAVSPAMGASERGRAEPKSRSLFDLPRGFFDSARLLSPSELRLGLQPPSSSSSAAPAPPIRPLSDGDSATDTGRGAAPRWTCNTCRAEFESLHDQRAHFQSDFHRLNVKLSIAGKNTIKEEDFDELDDDSLFKDFDVSSISGSEDELEKGSSSDMCLSGKLREEANQKLYIHLQSGDTVSIWKCLLLNGSEDFAVENSKTNLTGSTACMSLMEAEELFARLKYLVHEPRDKTFLRTVLLVSGGHFAGCVFDGNSIVAHKTFHRYVVRAKAGKKQSSKDATGRAAHSAGSSLRRHNEAALKKEIQDLLVTWKPFISSSSCIFIYAPSKNRQLLFDREKTDLSISDHVARYIPFTVRRPTLKEAKRIYNMLTYMTYELDEKAGREEDSLLHTSDEEHSNQQSDTASLGKNFKVMESSSASDAGLEGADLAIESTGETVSLSALTLEATPLHVAAKSGNAQLTLQLLEEGLNPCLKDERGRTPYTLAKDKEVRNTFRRFMALNLDKWDWHAASVPSPLTKEMEDSQAAKQAEKDAKRKAKAKELKKLRKAKEKAQAQAAQSQAVSTVVPQVQGVVPVSERRDQPKSTSKMVISHEEEQKRALAAEREKRAAAAEKRIAALNSHPNTTPAPSTSETKSQVSEVLCSCCNASLAGKVPFHRYNYKYCSTSCMYVHKEMLEDG